MANFNEAFEITTRIKLVEKNDELIIRKIY